MVSRRILETLTYLARNHPSVAKILLQYRLPHPPLQDPENFDQVPGKAVMVIEDEIADKKLHEEGYLSVALLLSLLNQPLYLRSIAHLEQVMLHLRAWLSLYKFTNLLTWFDGISFFPDSCSAPKFIGGHY